MRRHALGAILILAACGPADTSLPEVVALSAVGAQDQTPSPSPDGSQVAFWRPGPGGSELWVASATMANPRPLGVHGVLGGNAAIWSPDGQHIAVMAGMRNTADIVTVRVSDGELRWLVENPLIKIPVQFHPDGDRIVFAALTTDESVAGYTVSRSTLAVEPLIPGLATPHVGMVSPDGGTIVVTKFEGGHSTIWIADASDPASLRPLTTEGFEATPDLGMNAFSPDGSQLVFTSHRTGKRDLWVASLADGTTRQLTTDIQDDYAPAWSPDGRLVAFLSTRGRQTDVWVVPAAGGEAERVTDTRDAEFAVSWMGASTVTFAVAQTSGALWIRSLADGAEIRLTPDSLDVAGMALPSDRSRIAFMVTLSGGVEDLAVMPAAGGPITVVSRGGFYSNMRWSRDGTQLAYTSNEAGSDDIWVAEPGSSSAPRQLTSWQGFEQPIGWSGDGRAVYVVADRESRLGDLWKVPVDGSEPIRLTTDGTVSSGAVSWPREERELLVTRLQSGVQTLARRRADGQLVSITTPRDGFALGVDYSPTGELIAVGLLREGQISGRVQRSDDQRIVATLPPQSVPGPFSPDGSRMLIGMTNGVNNVADLAILTLATGETTSVTATPQSEPTGGFTADGESVILRRVESTGRVMRADVSGLLGRRPSS